MKFLQKEILYCGLFFAAICLGCSPKPTVTAHPPAVSASDAKAIAIADEVMLAMGGQKAWDETRYISWTFFGRRKLLWDKQAMRCRIEWLKRPLLVIVDLTNGTGQVKLDGVEQTQPDTLAKYLDLAKKVWINDSYWLVMPFKLRDPGVTLKYLGESENVLGEASDLLQLTFESVGVTPDNKYQVWVDKKSRLVTQWAYFKKFSDEKTEFTGAWNDYKRHGKILLSGNRGGDSSLEPLEVLETTPPEWWRL